jgi:hypothetical protein
MRCDAELVCVFAPVRRVVFASMSRTDSIQKAFPLPSTIVLRDLLVLPLPLPQYQHSLPNVAGPIHVRISRNVSRLQ